MTAPADENTQDRLEAFTGRLLRGDDFALPPHADDESAESAELSALVQSLHAAMTPVAPSEAFARRLRGDLLDEGRGFAQRMRPMPARLSIAALLALAAGCVLLVMRRLFGEQASGEMPEDAVPTSA